MKKNEIRITCLRTISVSLLIFTKKCKLNEISYRDKISLWKYTLFDAIHQLFQIFFTNVPVSFHEKFDCFIKNYLSIFHLKTILFINFNIKNYINVLLLTAPIIFATQAAMHIGFLAFSSSTAWSKINFIQMVIYTWPNFSLQCAKSTKIKKLKSIKIIWLTTRLHSFCTAFSFHRFYFSFSSAQSEAL